jgi:hypothetical protein
VASCPERYAPNILARHDKWRVPAFALQGGELWTFSDLKDERNPLVGETFGEVRRVAVAELEASVEHRRLLVQLLNWTFVSHVESLGLAVHRIKQRVWFPSDEGRERRVSYHGRVKRSTRRVTRPLPARRDGTRRWEHESIGYSFRRYEESWVLHIVPGWVFTHDGLEAMMRGPGVGRLATRRAARDYNPQVAHHLYFWLWVLARGQTAAPIDPHTGAVSIEGRLLAYDAVDAPAPMGPPGAERVDDAPAEDADADDERKAA